MDETRREGSSRRRRALRLVAIAGVVVLAVAAAPRVQAALRPKVPPTAAMRAASHGIDLARTSAEPPEVPVRPQTAREHVLVRAHELKGAPYEWGAKGPDAYDCSGFTKAAYAAGGFELPDGSFNQAEGEQPLASLDELSAGDLLFYRWNGNAGVTHVTLYLGSGWVIGTGSPGQPAEVVVYPLASDFRVPDTVVTFRHVRFSDE